MGQGVMGLNIMQVTRCCGAGKAIAVDVREDTLSLSGQLGADVVINAGKTDPIEAVKDATGGWERMWSSSVQAVAQSMGFLAARRSVKP